MKRYMSKGALALLAALLLAVAVLGPAACGGDGVGTPEPTTAPPIQTSGGSTTQTSGETTTSTSVASEGQIFTAEDLARFDGKDGRQAYVAVDGVVYDVTGSRSWPDGEHGRCDLGAAAGRDLSAEIGGAPANMRALLEKMPVVGSLAD